MDKNLFKLLSSIEKMDKINDLIFDDILRQYSVSKKKYQMFSNTTDISHDKSQDLLEIREIFKSQERNYFTISSKETFNDLLLENTNENLEKLIIYNPLNTHSRKFLKKGDVLFCYRQGQFSSLDEALNNRGIYAVGFAATDPIEMFEDAEKEHEKYGIVVSFPKFLSKHLALKNIQMHPNTINLTPYNGNRNDALQHIPYSIHYNTLIALIIESNPDMKNYFEYILEKKIKREILPEYKWKKDIVLDLKTSIIDLGYNRIIYGAPGTGKSYQLNQEVRSFPKLEKIKINPKKTDEKTINYWIATCGKDNYYWDKFYDKKKFAIGWGELGDLNQFNSLPNINERLMEKYNYGKANRTINYFKYMKTSMKKDDIIIIRKGRKNLIEGYGIITGDYEYDSSMPEDFYHTIPIEWKKKEAIVLEDYSRDLPWGTISSANDELVSLLSKNKYIDKEVETEEILHEVVDRVTFYDGYTHGQFVGTYKPVPEGDTITYKYIPGPFMKQLVESYKNPNYNFCLIIEEINRAKADKVFGNIFQLLDRDSDGKSEYHIAVSEDQEVYLREKLEDEANEILKDLLDKGLYIPKNLYIWATMNSADQGVYPMDSAFKRRWHFEHIGLDQNEDEFGKEGYTYELRYQKKSETEGTKKKIIVWNEFRKIINENLLRDNVSEDRLLAPFFIKENNFKSKENNTYILDGEVFKNKILMYLFDDVLRHKRKTILFDENIKSFSQLIEACEDGKVLFSKEIISNLDIKESKNESTSEED